jgi:GAF domain-containing protein/multidrug resistance efflux pump
MPDILSETSASQGESSREVERLRLLHALSLEFSSSLDFDELLPRVFHRVLETLGAEGGSIWIAEGDVLRCRLAVGGRGERLIGAEVPVGTGFVGDVAQQQKTTIVTRAQEDPRFQPGIDRSEDAIALNVMATAMVTEGVTVGAIQVSNKTTGDGMFDAGDRELLEGVAALASVSLRNARLHAAERRANELAVLLDISREITATLDLDRVLQSVVHLAARALPFDRGAVGLYDKGRCDIRAVSGEEKIDSKDTRLQDLVGRAEWAAGRGESFYLTDRTAPASDAERMFITIFGPDLEKDDVVSGLYLPLKDEEGVLGVLVFESGTADFSTPTQREVAAILANQTAVALRNAQLYHQVPMVDALGAIAARRRAIAAMPRRKVLIGAAVTAVIVALLCLVRWPYRVPGEEAAFRPTSFAPVRALVPGVVERIPVREGMPIARGTPVAYLRANALRADREATAADAASADRLASLAASRGDAAEERLQRMRADALRRELSLIDEELGLTVLRAPISGTVLTARTEERTGMSLEEGDLLMTIGRTDSLELDFVVDQRDIGRVRPGQEVRLRTEAIPQRTFTGRVIGVAPQAVDSGTASGFPVRAIVPNPDGLLRPSQPAYVRVLTDPESAAMRVLRGPARWIRLQWWRLWS